MPITSLKFRPGINKETTSYSNKGGWNDCDLVRFRFGYPEKLGGWEKYSENTFLGTARSLHTWANLLGDNYIGIGTEQKFYIEEAEDFKDITPLRRKVVNGVTVFDLSGLAITATPSGSAGTGQVGTVTVETVQRPVSANIFATGQVGTVTVEDTRNESVTVG